MANIKCLFKLKDARSTTPTSIRLIIYHKDFLPKGELVYGTGETIEPKYFDVKRGRPITDREMLRQITPGIGRAEQRAMDLLNDTLNEIEVCAKKIAERRSIERIPLEVVSFRMLLDQGLGHLGRKNPPSLAEVQPETTSINGFPIEKPRELNAYIRDYMHRVKCGRVLTPSGKEFTPGSVKNYTTFWTQFDLFQRYTHKRLDFRDINQEFYNSFVRFLTGKNYSTNTIGKHIARLKKIMRSAKEEGVYEGAEHEKTYFKTLEVDVESIYLTSEELEKIAQLDLSKNQAWELYRDVFLIGCYTAQRVSDYKAIKPQHISKTSKGVKILKLIQQKTGEEVMIPIRPQLETLLAKYNYNIPTIHDQKLNERIKLIAEKAGIVQPIEIQMVKGGKTIRDVYRKCELIKTHTARRTGATNMYLAGIPTIDIMKLTGHKKESNFLKYICISKEETADKLSSHPYFQ